MTQLVLRTWTRRNPPGLSRWPLWHRQFLRQRPQPELLGWETSASTDSHSGVAAPNAPLLSGTRWGAQQAAEAHRSGQAQHARHLSAFPSVPLKQWGQLQQVESTDRFPQASVKTEFSGYHHLTMAASPQSAASSPHVSTGSSWWSPLRKMDHPRCRPKAQWEWNGKISDDCDLTNFPLRFDSFFTPTTPFLIRELVQTMPY